MFCNDVITIKMTSCVCGCITEEIKISPMYIKKVNGLLRIIKHAGMYEAIFDVLYSVCVCVCVCVCVWRGGGGDPPKFCDIYLTNLHYVY